MRERKESYGQHSTFPPTPPIKPRTSLSLSLASSECHQSTSRPEPFRWRRRCHQLFIIITLSSETILLPVSPTPQTCSTHRTATAIEQMIVCCNGQPSGECSGYNTISLKIPYRSHSRILTLRAQFIKRILTFQASSSFPSSRGPGFD